MNQHFSKYSGWLLSWFFSGRFWYVTAVDKRTKERLRIGGTRKPFPCGAGRSEKEALDEMIQLIDNDEVTGDERSEESERTE